MAGTLVRRAKVELMYRGVNLAEYAVHCEYTDHADGAGDELCVRLEDRDLKWQGPWMPAKGEQVTAAIVCLDWPAPGEHWWLDCGSFGIGEIDLKGPPDMVEIKAVSIKPSGNARTQRKSKAWEGVDLRTIAAHTADKAGLQLHFDGASPVYDRIDQRQEADLKFLERLATEAGNSVKVAHEKLVVYSGEKWEQRGPHGTLIRGEDWIKNYHFSAGVHDNYRKAKLTFWHPELKEWIVGSFVPPNAPPTGEVLRLNSPVKDQAEAIAKAKSRLRAKNRHEVKADIVVVGDPRRRATQVMAVQGFGHFDGNYFIDKAGHQIDRQQGFETTLHMRKVLPY